MSHKQFVRRARSTMKKQRPCEILARDITCKGEQEPTREQLGTLILHMQDTFKRQLIFRVFAKRLGDSGSLWTHPLKVLHVFEYMLRQRHSAICADIYMFREHIKSLSAFTHYEGGMDRGAIVRDKARAVLQALDRWAAEDGNTGLISSTSSASTTTTTTPQTPPSALSPETGFHNFSSPHMLQLAQPSPQQSQPQHRGGQEGQPTTAQREVVPRSSRIEQQRQAYRLQQQQRSRSLDEVVADLGGAQCTVTPGRPSSPGYDPPHVRREEARARDEQLRRQRSLPSAETQEEEEEEAVAEPFYMPLPPPSSSPPSAHVQHTQAGTSWEPTAAEEEHEYFVPLRLVEQQHAARTTGMSRASMLASARAATGGVAAWQDVTEQAGAHNRQHEQYPQPPPPTQQHQQQHHHPAPGRSQAQQQQHASSEEAALEEAMRRSVVDARAREHQERERALEDYHLQLALELSRVEQ